MSFSPEMVVARRKTIGASDVPIILGLSRWKTAEELYAEKMEEGPGIISRDSEASLWGHLIEPLIVERFRVEIDALLLDRPFRSRTHADFPWATCSPDGWVVYDGEPLGVEAKNRHHGSLGWGPSGSSIIPPDVEAQVRWSMFVTDTARWGVGVLIGGNTFRHYFLYRDRVWEEWALPIVEAFREGVFLTPPAFAPVKAHRVRIVGVDETDAIVTLQNARETAKLAGEYEEHAKKVVLRHLGQDDEIVGVDRLGRKVTASQTVVRGRVSTDWDAVVGALVNDLTVTMDAVVAEKLVTNAVQQHTARGAAYRRLQTSAGPAGPSPSEAA